MNAFPPLTPESWEHPKPPTINRKHIILPYSLDHMIVWHEHSPGVSQGWPIGLYAVATPAITATDTIIEVSENFMFVVRRVLRLMIYLVLS